MKTNQHLVHQANHLSSSDLLNLLLLHSNFSNPKNYQIEICYARQLSNEYQQQIMDLFEINMKHFYEQSQDGYNCDDKRKELFSPRARYLLILASNVIIAFTHFRFDMDYGRRVLYLYELQVNMKYQGQGLGRWIMDQLTILCQKTQMLKIVLTVQKMNEKAIDFYMKKCQFVADVTNPSDGDVDYLILSLTV